MTRGWGGNAREERGRDKRVFEMDKIAVVGDVDTVTGFRLAGVEEAVSTYGRDANAVVSEMLEKKGIGMLVVTVDCVDELNAKVKRVLTESVKPVVVVVPSRREVMERGGESVAAMLKKAIGIDIK